MKVDPKRRLLGVVQGIEILQTDMPLKIFYRIAHGRDRSEGGEKLIIRQSKILIRWFGLW